MADELGQRQAERDLAHPGYNERYWVGRCEQMEARMVLLEQAAAHFYHCWQCAEGPSCEEGERYAGALGLIKE